MVEDLGYLEGQVAGNVIEHHISNTLATRYQHISNTLGDLEGQVAGAVIEHHICRYHLV